MDGIELYCGDCLDILPTLQPVNLVLSDPPYGITRRNEWDVVIPVAEMWNAVRHVTTPTTAVLLFGKLPFGCDLIQSNRKEFRYEWIWKKTSPVGFLNANRMPMCVHESVYVFYKKLPAYNPQFWLADKAHTRGGRNRQSSNYGKFTVLPASPPTRECYPRDVVEFSNAVRNGRHPTEKPVDLLEYLIKTYTNEGDTVLDFCMGSGSTGVACIRTGRHFIGIEKDEHFFNMAKERIKKEMETAS